MENKQLRRRIFSYYDVPAKPFLPLVGSLLMSMLLLAAANVFVGTGMLTLIILIVTIHINARLYFELELVVRAWFENRDDFRRQELQRRLNERGGDVIEDTEVPVPKTPDTVYERLLDSPNAFLYLNIMSTLVAVMTVSIGDVLLLRPLIVSLLS